MVSEPSTCRGFYNTSAHFQFFSWLFFIVLRQWSVSGTKAFGVSSTNFSNSFRFRSCCKWFFMRAWKRASPRDPTHNSPTVQAWDGWGIELFLWPSRSGTHWDTTHTKTHTAHTHMHKHRDCLMDWVGGGEEGKSDRKTLLFIPSPTIALYNQTYKRDWNRIA